MQMLAALLSQVVAICPRGDHSSTFKTGAKTVSVSAPSVCFRFSRFALQQVRPSAGSPFSRFAFTRFTLEHVPFPGDPGDISVPGLFGIRPCFLFLFQGQDDIDTDQYHDEQIRGVDDDGNGLDG